MNGGAGTKMQSNERSLDSLPSSWLAEVSSWCMSAGEGFRPLAGEGTMHVPLL
jgi:hypothetical protein